MAGRRVGRAGWNKDASVYIITAETLMDGCIGNFLIVARILSLSLSLSLSLLGFCTSDPASIGRFGSRVGVHVGRVDGDSAGWTGLWQPCETASRGVDASFSTCACEGPKVATHREAMAAAAVPPAPVPRWTFYECPASGCSSQAFKRANLTSWETEDCGNVCVVVVLVASYC